MWGDYLWPRPPFLLCAAQLPYGIYFKHCQDAFDAMSFLRLPQSVCSVFQPLPSLVLLFLPCDNFKGKEEKTNFLSWTYDPALHKRDLFFLKGVNVLQKDAGTPRPYFLKYWTAHKQDQGSFSFPLELYWGAAIHNSAVFLRGNEMRQTSGTEKDHRRKRGNKRV